MCDDSVHILRRNRQFRRYHACRHNPKTKIINGQDDEPAKVVLIDVEPSRHDCGGNDDQRAGDEEEQPSLGKAVSHGPPFLSVWYRLLGTKIWGWPYRDNLRHRSYDHQDCT